MVNEVDSNTPTRPEGSADSGKPEEIIRRPPGNSIRVFLLRVRTSSIISMDISTYQVNIFDVDVVGAVVVVVHTIL